MGVCPMKVGYDVAPLVLDNAGTARYVRGVLAGLRLRDDVELRELTWGAAGRAVAVARDALWYPVGLPLQARRLDVLHCTTFRAPIRAAVPVVVTVHDLAIVRYPQHFTPWTRLYARTLLLPVLRSATRIVAVSEFTKRDVAELAGVPPDRIDVAYNAADTTVFRPDGPAAAGEYALAIGTLEPRKNLARVVEATGRLGLELRIAGARGWGAVDVTAPHVRWLGRPSDRELAEQLRGARCLVYPSLWEGFGIPVLEAMLTGTPVVTSAGSAMAEVAAAAAELVEPTDVGSITSGIERALGRSEELRDAGFARARAFGWDRTVEAVVESYRRALS